MNDTKNPIVVIFTYRSPFGSVPEFVEDEIPFWGAAKKVLVISLAEYCENSISFGPNAIAHSVCPAHSLIGRLKFLLKGLRHIEIIREFGRILLSGPTGFIEKLKALTIHTMALERYFQGTWGLLEKEEIGADDTVIMYSYWCGPATHSAVQLNARRFNNRAIVVTRVHGSDFYEYSNSSNYLPLREWIFTSCNHIYSISQHGVYYLNNHWKVPLNKIELARLGIPDHVLNISISDNQWFHILSCSYITPGKRVHLIAEALAKIEGFNIRWTHIGGGQLFDEFRATTKSLLKHKSNICYDLLGSLDHSKVIELFRTENINLFVNVSISEGIPVSMMEAHCSGIPVIGPNIGGVKEIVEQGINGRLLIQDFTVDNLKDEILSIIHMDKINYSEMCYNARKSWENRFSSECNYPQFINSVIRSYPHSSPRG